MRSKHPRRNAFTLTELVVGAALTVTVMSVVASLTVHCGRLWQDTRHQQLVMDELSNELERLISLPADQRGFDRPVDGDGVGGAQCDIGAVEYADCNANNN